MTPARSRLDYVLLVGHGRSGSNWLLELLDLSPHTHCRNEPDEIPGSPLAALYPERTVVRDDPELLRSGWDAAVRHTVSCMGERDGAVRAPKRHLHGWAQRLGVYRVVRGPRLRSWAATALPGLRGGEWRLPRYLGSRTRLAEALPVLKVLLTPGWTAFVLRERPTVGVLHIVRHPGGYMSSWASRYLAKHDPEHVARENRARLREIAAVHPDWGERFGDVGALSLEESELWYWRFANERTWELGRDRPRYRRVLYREIVDDPLGTIRGAYEHCELPWSPEIEQEVLGTTGRSKTIAGQWRRRLTEPQQALAERILEGSPMRAWWPEGEPEV